MTDLPKSIYTSVPFKFVINGKPFYIPTELVSLHSKPLVDRIMNGSTAEAQKDFEILEDVDEDTFVRFIEWAHKGFYTAATFSTASNSQPSPRSRSPEASSALQENIPESEPGPPVDVAPAEPAEPYEHSPPSIWEGPKSSNKKYKNQKKAGGFKWGGKDVHDYGGFNWERKDAHDDGGFKRDLKEEFKSRTFTVRRVSVDIDSHRPNEKPDEDYTNVFLSHAQLYIFAENYDIEPLKMLALEELHATLVVYTLYPERTGDIIELLRYIYDKTCKPPEGADDMRSMMTQYVSYEMDVLMRAPEFGELMIKDGGDLLDDFMKAVLTRISPQHKQR